MEATELRIGNLVYPDMSYPEPITVCSKDFEDTTHLEPIPLTEERLLEFGFDNLGAYGWGIGIFHIRFREIHKFYFTIENRIIRIKHVHQLQNLYFALTNEELTIKSSNTVD